MAIVLLDGDVCMFCEAFWVENQPLGPRLPRRPICFGAIGGSARSMALVSSALVSTAL